MCEVCTQIQAEIELHRKLLKASFDPVVRERVRIALVQLQKRKAALHGPLSPSPFPSEAPHPSIPLMEVLVFPDEVSGWKWIIAEGNSQVAQGYSTSREAAQSAGDSMLFKLLSEGH